MSYTVKRTNGTTVAEVADQTIVTSEVPVALVGRGAVNYGQAHSENFVKLCENFANPTPPSKPMVGMLWFDTTTSPGVMKHYTGTAWKTIGSGMGDGGTGSGGTTLPGGGTTIGGDLNTGNRTAGSTGVVVSSGAAATTVNVAIAEGRIISVESHEEIAYALLPAVVTIDTKEYAFKERFPLGIAAGITIATDARDYVLRGTATSALYADLAERYASNEALEPGTVVEIGGEAEIRKTISAISTDVFGVISTKPGFLLNEAAGDDSTHPFVALSGRVPCKVIGVVKKGQRLVSSDLPGVAMAAHGGEPAQAILGRALQDKNTDDLGVVEIVLGGVK